MKKLIVAVGAMLLAAGGLLLSLAPDTLSIIMIVIMCIVIILGFLLGLMPALTYGNGFKNARQSVEQALDVQAAETWIAVFKLDTLFRQRDLDGLFKE